MNHLTLSPRRRNLRAFIAAFITYIMLVGQMAPLALAARGPAPRPAPKSEAVANVTTTQPAPVAAAPVPQPLVFAPVITATKTDAFPVHPSGKAEPGDVITYTVTINNTGPDPATNVTLTDTVDSNTTIVPGSAVATPIAVDETYNVLGNVRIQPNAAAGLLANDTNPNTGNNTGLTASGPTTGPTNGQATVAADGSFTYNPNPGFTGTDSFTYTITSSSGTDTATVTLKVGDGAGGTTGAVIFFVNDDAPAGGDGRLTNPFNCLAGAGASCFSTTTADEAGDIIFLFAGTYADTAALTLLNNQKLIGQGASAGTTLQAIAGVTVPPNSDTLPTLNGDPSTVGVTSTAAGIIVTAGFNNELRGFTVGNTTGAKIQSAAFGTLTVSEVALTGTGQALNLDSGTLAATFTGISSTNAAGQGILLDQIAGTLTSTNGTSIVNPATQCILVSASTANMNFGNTGCSDATDGISLQNNSAGTRTFGTLTVSGTNTGSAFLHSGGGGNTTINGAAALTSGAVTTIDIQNEAAGTTVNFAGGATLVKTAAGGTGVNLNTANGNVTFSSLTIGTSGSRFPTTGVTITNGGTAAVYSLGTVSIFTNGFAGITATDADGTLNSTSGTVDVLAATALNINGPAGLTTLGMTLTTVNSTGGTNNVSLADVGGALTISGGALSGASGASFLVTTGPANITYNGTIANNTARVVDIQGKTAGGTVAFGGAISSSGGTGVFLNNNATATINFTGGLSLSTGANTAFTATGGGTVNATQNNTSIVNTLTTTTATALNVANTNIGASGITFRSISSNGAANGIVLNTTGTSGGLTVTGNSNGLCGGQVTGVPATVTAPNTADCTGGVIQSSTGAGILLTSTSNVSLTRIRIANGQDDGVFGTTVTGFTLVSSLIENNGNAVDEANLDFANLHGTSSVTNSAIRLAHENNIEVRNSVNNGAQATLSVTGSTINNDSTKIQSTDGVLYEGTGTSNMSVTVSGCALFANRGDHLQAVTNDDGDMVAVFTNNTLSGGHTLGQGQDIVINTGALNPGASFTYDINGNVINGAILSAITATLGAPSVGAAMSGRIRNNIIGTSGVPESGSRDANGITINHQDRGTLTASITGNTIRQWEQRGISASAFNNATAPSGLLNLTIQSNTILEGNAVDPVSGVGGREAVLVIAGSSAATDLNTVCLQLGGAGALANNVNRGPEAVVSGEQDIRLRARSASTFRLPGYAGGAADTTAVAAFVASMNTSSVDGVVTVAADKAATSNGFVGGAACATPAINFAPARQPIPVAMSPVDAAPAAASTVASAASNVLPTLTNRLREVVSATSTAPDASNSLDTNTSKRDGGTTLRHSAAATSAPLGTEPLALTQRKKTPTAPESKPAPRAPLPTPLPPVINGDTLTFTIGTLPANSSVTITFQVTVDNPYSGGPNVSNQGTVTADGSISVLTDDPAVAGTNNPTLTPIDSINIFVRDAKVGEPAAGQTNMLFTVALSAPATSSVQVNFTTADGGANPATGGASCAPGIDYITTAGTLGFTAGQQVQIVSVPVCSDAAAEADETFLLQLSNAIGGTIQDGTATGTITLNTPGTFLISELRTSGPGGLGDDFVELYNNTGTPLTVPAGGFGVFKLGADCGTTPTLIATIPATTVIPARGHFLVVGSQYSLGAYATGNVTMTSDIESDRNVGVFSTTDIASISSDNRLDAAGFDLNPGGNVCALLREGTPLPSVSGSTTQYSFFRKECDFQPGVGCTTQGTPKDTNDNSVDFFFADTQGTFISGVTQRLGAPGPQNLASPIKRDPGVSVSLLDNTKSAAATPNRVRDLTSNPGNNSTAGTISIRRRVTNNTGAPVTRLRFRIIEMTTFPSPGGGQADLRAITSGSVSVSGIGDAGTCNPAAVPCTLTVQGTTLEQPPTQPNGGGYNSTLAAGTITVGTPLANGAAINLQFLLGVQQTGTFRFLIIVEALP